MGIWSDIAQWRGPTVNQGGSMYQQRGVVIHIAQGSYEGTISWQKNPDAEVSSHFVVDYDGTIAQMVDTDRIAWTQADGNGYWLSIENAGWTPDPLTSDQVDACARILAKAHEVYGCDLVVAYDPSDYGLGHHSMGAPDWGHSECPGPNIIDQKPSIVEIAEEGDMPSAEDIAKAVWNLWLGKSGPSAMTAQQSGFHYVQPGGSLDLAIEGVAAQVTTLDAQVDTLTTMVQELLDAGGGDGGTPPDPCAQENVVRLVRMELAHHNRFNVERVRGLIREELGRALRGLPPVPSNVDSETETGSATEAMTTKSARKVWDGGE